MRIHNTITKAYRAIPGTMLLVAAVLVSLIIAISASAGPISVASAGQEKVTVCHLPGTPAEVTLETPHTWHTGTLWARVQIVNRPRGAATSTQWCRPPTSQGKTMPSP